MKLFVEAIADMDELMSIEREWEALNKEIEPRTPFTSPLWIRLWWKHFRREHLWAKDYFFVHIVRDEKGRLIAVVPLMCVCRPAFGPVRLRILRFFGADTSLTEVRGVICGRSDETAVFRALQGILSAKGLPWDVIEWNGIRSGGEAKGVLKEAGPLGLPEQTTMYIMRLPESWKELIASVSSNMRKSVRKAYEALQSSGGAFDFRVIERVEDVGDALHRFFRLHSLRAAVKGMIAHPDKFKDHRNRAFITEYITETAMRGNLRIFELSIEGDVVASRLSFYLNDTLYFYYAGYDPSWRSSSVGTILMAEALKWSMRQGIKTVNLSAGKDHSKLRWRPKELVYESYTQLASSLRARILGEGYVRLHLAVRRFSSSRRRGSRQPGQETLPPSTAGSKASPLAQSTARWTWQRPEQDG